MKKIWFVVVALLLTSSFLGVEVVNEVISNEGIVIYIDPGHGGKDGGAQSECGAYEKDIVLAISLKLRDYFIDQGFKVMMTRDSDIDLAPQRSKNRKRDDIHKRVKLINQSRAELFLSIHANSYPGSSIFGAQCFYRTSDPLSNEIATSIQGSLLINMLNTYRHAKPISGVYLIDHVTIPGALIEVGFLSNANDLANLQDDHYQDKIAHAIYLGVYEYLVRNNKIESNVLNEE